MKPDVWSPIDIDSDELLAADIGPLRLLVRQRREEIHIAWINGVEAEPAAGAAEASGVERIAEEPPGLDWTRWVVGPDVRQIRFQPIMPDRSAVVRPEAPVKIPTGREALFFVRVPLWVKVLAGDPEPLELSTAPSVILSNSWFGDPLGGELCYAMRTTARRRAEEHTVAPHRAVVPMRVRNEADEALDVTRICLAVKHLNIYRGERCFWTNQVNAHFRGADQATRLQFESGPPRYAGQAPLVAERREPAPHGLLRRTFVSSLLNLKMTL